MAPPHRRLGRTRTAMRSPVETRERLEACGAPECNERRTQLRSQWARSPVQAVQAVQSVEWGDGAAVPPGFSCARTRG